MTRPKIFRDRSTTTPATEFAERLRDIRLLRRMSLADLHRATGFAVSTLSQLESGARPATKDAVERLEVALKDVNRDLYYAYMRTRITAHRRRARELEEELQITMSGLE